LLALAAVLSPASVSDGPTILGNKIITDFSAHFHLRSWGAAWTSGRRVVTSVIHHPCRRCLEETNV
jgi:hypothetical protein